MDTLIPSNLPAPDFELLGLDGRCFRLSDQIGKVVVLNFWSAECPWVRRNDADLAEYLHAWRERVVLSSIASNVNEGPGQIAQVAAERALPVVLLDERHQVADLYGAQTTPHAFVIDAKGILRYQGAMNDITFRQRYPTRFYLKDAVEAVLAGKRPEPEWTPAYGCTIIRHSL